MTDPFSKTAVCKNCNIKTLGVLHLHIRQSGARGYMWVCSRCNRRGPFDGPLFIANDLVERHLTKEQIDSLPVIMPDASSRCVRCGRRDCELHHWAPRAIFGDAECEQWPKDYLCKECHDLWHMLVTPQLVHPKPIGPRPEESDPF